MKTNTNTTKQFDAINIFRLIFAYFVIVVHTNAFQCFGDTAAFIGSFWIGMLAIPFFFATSGYFLYSNFNKKDYLKRYIKKLSLIFIVASILYVPLFLPQMYPDLSTKGIRYIFQTVIIYSLPGHLWYISTLLMSAVVIYFFLKKNWIKPLIILSIILFIPSVIGQGYSALVENTVFMDFVAPYNYIFDRLRNGFTFGIPYMTMGIVINHYKLNEKIRNTNLWFIVSVILYAIEGYIFLVYRTGIESYVYFSHILIVPVMVIMLLNSKISLKKETSNNLRDLSLWVYVYHVALIKFGGMLMPWLFKIDFEVGNYANASCSLLRWIPVSIIATIIAYLIHVVRLKLKNQKSNLRLNNASENYN